MEDNDARVGSTDCVVKIVEKKGCNNHVEIVVKIGEENGSGKLVEIVEKLVG